MKTEVDKSALYVWKEPPPISVDEILLALSCKKSNLACIQKMGPILNADTVALVAGAPGQGVTLTLVQFSGDKRVRTDTIPLTPVAQMIADRRDCSGCGSRHGSNLRRPRDADPLRRR